MDLDSFHGERGTGNVGGEGNWKSGRDAEIAEEEKKNPRAQPGMAVPRESE
jgi:hypothetical protein